jgi:hypothetical protein
MTLSVRIPPKVEQELAEYCARKGVSKSEAVKDALDQFLSGKSAEKSPYEVMTDLIGPLTDEAPSEDVARHSKRLLRERVRSKRK